MATRVFLLFLCFLMLFSTAAVYQAKAETIEEYKERMKREQEEAEKKKKKNRGKDDKSGSPDLSGLCNCLGSIFEAMASTDIEVSIVDSSDRPAEPETPAPDGDPDRQDDSDKTDGTPPQEKPPEDGAGEPTAADTTGEKQPAGPAFPLFTVSLGGAYLFGQEISLFDLTARLVLNVEFFHVNTFYQYLGDAAGSSLNSFSANIGFIFPFSPVVASVFGGVFWQEGFSVQFSFGTNLKIAFTDSLFLEISSLFSFYAPFYFIVLSPTLELALGHFTCGLGFNYFNYNGLNLYGPTAKIGLWF